MLYCVIFIRETRTKYMIAQILFTNSQTMRLGDTICGYTSWLRTIQGPEQAPYWYEQKIAHWLQNFPKVLYTAYNVCTLLLFMIFYMVEHVWTVGSSYIQCVIYFYSIHNETNAIRSNYPILIYGIFIELGSYFGPILVLFWSKFWHF